MPILSPNTLEVISRSADQTKRAGMRLGALLQSGDVVCLQGDLGSGKTTLVKGIAAGWGSPDQASSPTFVLVNVYRRPDGNRIYHLDAYRLSGAADAEDLDLDAMLESGPLLIEWAERILPALPATHLRITMKYVDEFQRDMFFDGRGLHYEALLANYRKQLYGV
jgi:tRNA threonylcarbamoyladenosine biosynthesis protein TsaE